MDQRWVTEYSMPSAILNNFQEGAERGKVTHERGRDNWKPRNPDSAPIKEAIGKKGLQGSLQKHFNKN